ncbi:MAG: 3-methyl-2-oxobutanoate hydroxymethyltransferase [Cellvibrionales bacterium]|nr:3-methyl-2-oxobutanoate hydroxymethyltransferase [Cellvibrionales bacterium]
MTVTINTLQQRKQNQETFTCITAYDASFTRLMNQVGIECLLIGDSLGMVLQGHKTTTSVTVDDICYHTASVARANENSFILADMPFMSFATVDKALTNAEKLIRAGANMVKIECGAWAADITEKLHQNGIPVCAHIGLLPQAVHIEGGYKIQGKTPEQAAQMIKDAKTLESAGCQMLLMECVLASTAKAVDEAINIPTIGIGAGPTTTGQVLVMHDILGVYPTPPKFSKNFMKASGSIQEALETYHLAVKNREFPSIEHSFTAD